MKFASMDDPFPRGTFMGKTGHRSATERSRALPKMSALCGGYVDLSDKAWIDEHQQPLPHPACDRAQ
jgi:hypothetical protein